MSRLINWKLELHINVSILGLLLISISVSWLYEQSNKVKKVLLLTSIIGIWLPRQFNPVKDENSSIPVKSAIFKKEHSNYPAKTERGKVLLSFCESLINNIKKPIVNDDEVFTTTSICLAAEQAVKIGQKINIEYL